MTKEKKGKKKRKRNKYEMNIKKSGKKPPEYYEDMKSNKNSSLIHVSDVFG